MPRLFTDRRSAWIPNTDLTPLKAEDCKDSSGGKKTKALISAYEVAAEGHSLQHFKDMLADHARALQEDEDAREAAAAERAAKSEKKKRKSEVKVADDDVEMPDADTETPAKKSSKKRKKEAESDDEQTEKVLITFGLQKSLSGTNSIHQAAKTPKTTKLKLTTKQTPVTDKKTKEPKPAKPKSDKKSKKAIEDEKAEEEKQEEPQDPVEARKAREKEGKQNIPIVQGSSCLCSVCSSIPATQASEGVPRPRSSSSRRRDAANVKLHQKARSLRRS